MPQSSPFWSLYPFGNLWKPRIFYPHIYILHKISSRPSRNPWTSGVQDCRSTERPAAVHFPTCESTRNVAHLNTSLTAVADLAGVPSWPAANILGGLTKSASSLALNVKSEVSWSSLADGISAWEFLSFRLVRKRREKGSKGERKEWRERKTRGSDGAWSRHCCWPSCGARHQGNATILNTVAFALLERQQLRN